MRLPRPRFTVRWLMIAVAIVGLACGGWGAWWRYRAVVALREGYERAAVGCSAFANYHESEAREWDWAIAEKKKDPGRIYWKSEAMIRSAACERQMAGHYRALAKKYAYAARYPWFPVEPDREFVCIP